MYIASASSNLNIHKFPSCDLLYNYQPKTHMEGSIRSISWSREGRWLVCVSQAGYAEILSVKDELKVLQTISNINNATCAVFQNNSNKILALGNEKGLIMIYDTKRRTVKNRFEGCSKITHLDYTSKDTHIVAGCRNGDVLVFNTVINGPASMLRVPKSNSVSCLKTNHNRRNLILGGSNDGVVVVWDIHVSRPKFSKNVHESPVNSAAFSPINSNLIVSAGSDRQFCFHDIEQKECIASVTVDNNMMAVDFSYDGLYFVMVSQNGKMHIYDSRNILTPVQSLQVQNHSLKHVAFQKIIGGGVASTSNISIKESSSIEPTAEFRKRLNSDMFNLLTPTINDSENKHKSVSSLGRDDSFLDNLFLANTQGSLLHESSIKVSPKISILKDTKGLIPTPKRLRSTEEKVKQFDFTPAQLPTTLQSDLLSLPEFKTIIKESIREEVKSIMKEIKADMEYHLVHMKHQLHTACLGIYVQLTREFIKKENYLRNINLEKERLIRQIEFLEKLVSSSKN